MEVITGSLVKARSEESMNKEMVVSCVATKVLCKWVQEGMEVQGEYNVEDLIVLKQPEM